MSKNIIVHQNKLYKIPSLDDYCKSTIVKYPEIYYRENFNISKLLILDHLLNVIGNGIYSDNEFLKYITKYIILDSTYKEWLKTNENLYKQRNKLKSEKINVDLESYFFPYPNFNKEYSTVYKLNILHKLNKDWITGFIWFYTECQVIFDNYNSNKYTNSEINIINEFISETILLLKKI